MGCQGLAGWGPVGRGPGRLGEPREQEQQVLPLSALGPRQTLALWGQPGEGHRGETGYTIHMALQEAGGFWPGAPDPRLPTWLSPSHPPTHCTSTKPALCPQPCFQVPISANLTTCSIHPLVCLPFMCSFICSININGEIDVPSTV